jgi:hypothetical protein
MTVSKVHTVCRRAAGHMVAAVGPPCIQPYVRLQQLRSTLLAVMNVKAVLTALHAAAAAGGSSATHVEQSHPQAACRKNCWTCLSDRTICSSPQSPNNTTCRTRQPFFDRIR